MSLADALRHAADKPAGKRPHFIEADAERVLAITMVLAQELAVARARIDTLERMLDDQQVIDRAAIDTYAPSPAAQVERAAWQQEYVARLLRYVSQEGQALAEDGG